MSSCSIMEAHDKMRARDISKVVKGQEAPRPPHQYGTVSTTTPPQDKANEKEAKKFHHCYSCYLKYLTCTKQKGEQASECKKLANDYKSNCPCEWIEKWNEEQKHEVVHDHV